MNSLKRLNPYILKYKFPILLGILFIICTNFFSIYSIKFIGKSVDLVGVYLEKTPENYNILLIQAGWIIFYAFLSGVFKYYMRQTIIVSSRKIENDLKNDIFKHYQKLSLTFYKDNKIGDLMNRITEDVASVRMHLGPGIMYSINLFFLLIITLYFMINISLTLTLWALAPLPVLSFFIYKISNIISSKSKNLQKSQSDISAFVQDSFSGIRVIKAFSKENKISEDYQKKSLKYKLNAISLAKTEAFFFPLMMFIIGFSYILIIYIGSKEYQSGKINIGGITNFFMYINILIWPFTSIGWVTSLKQRAKASMQRINEFLDTNSEIEESGTLKVNFNKIEFKNVSFTYKNTGIQALKNINFILNKGDNLAIMGKTGSGKTTILLLISRLLDPSEGTILINDVNIKEYSITELRNILGIVPQESFLFSDSIFNNIALGNPNSNKESVEENARKTCIHDSIKTFDKQYQTIVGERGITLSGGQKQRISIARALIKNPEILMLDDSLSAIDTETEEQILNNLNDDLNKLTSIIVTHRISSAKNADFVIILENGTIIEQGKPKELIIKNGIYKELYNNQIEL